MTYEEWELEQGISPSSPEAYYAEKAWQAAIDSAVGLLTCGHVVSYWVTANKGQLAGHGQYEIIANSDEGARVIAKLRGLSAYNVANAPSEGVHQHGRLE